MTDRRDFLKKAAMLAGSTALFDGLPASIQRAMAIAPAPGTTWRNAEHVVILMQENRSFDHCYGSLRGVRGFNDPRAITLPDGKPVWLQTNAAGQTYSPFRLNIRDTKATWMSSLPHSWTNQVDARNGGRYDKWLDAKPSGHKEYAHMPLTLGFYNRQDIPFYYALADAFTVCDQNFCSSLTGTTPNRLYFWTGQVRENPNALARVRNEDLDYDKPAAWKTYPERLSEANISWRIYQNEINLSTGLSGDEEAWLANFSDNPIEWFSQYAVKAHPGYQRYRVERLQQLPDEIKNLETRIASLSGETAQRANRELTQKRNLLAALTAEKPLTFSALPKPQQNLHQRAFTTNTADPNYRTLTTHTYDDNGQTRRMKLPKGDVLHQFRADVNSGKLPVVSWLVAPEMFSDHPSAPWFGAWYVSEVLDILTHNPLVWQKTIFILAYDENDGYFDHVPPFVAPHPDQPDTGRTSAGIDTRTEHVSLEQEHSRAVKDPKSGARASAIGLGFRVPLVVASPWSRGGYVCSEVFDHTSTLQFLEQYLQERFGKTIRETNISQWRRAVCGNLTSAFRPYNGEPVELPNPVTYNPFMESIDKAQYKDVPKNFHPLSRHEIEQAQNPNNGILPRQEPGTRPATALPYELRADAAIRANGQTLTLTLAALNQQFGKSAAGAPFTVYDMQTFSVRNYALMPGDTLTDELPLSGSSYHIRVYGPNGFYREFRGDNSLGFELAVLPAVNANAPALLIRATASQALSLQLTDLSYQAASQTLRANPNQTAELSLPLSKSFGWYDWQLRIGTTTQWHYAGRVETGQPSQSDPAMA